MKITHFNGFDEDNNFRRKLKQKMQNLEPEVSNTLWDRIELNMANQQEKKSKKGLLLLVWFLTIGFTALLTWGVYDWTSAHKNNEVISEQNKKLYVNDAPITVPLISDETSQKIAENKEINSVENTIENNTNTSQNNDVKSSKNNYSNDGGNYQARNKNLSKNNQKENVFNNIINPDEHNNNKLETQTETDKNNKITETPNKFNNTDENLLTQGKTPELNTDKLIEIDTAKIVSNNPNIAKSTKENKKLNFERFSLVFSQISVYNYRSVKVVNGNSPHPAIAGVKDKNNYEKGAYTYNNFNFGLQYKVANHWYINAGYGTFTLQNNVQYDSIRKKDLTPIIAEKICGDEKDSMIIGNNNTQSSIWNITQIPVEVTYKNNLGRKLSYIVGSGIEYNIVKNYMYRMYDARVHNAFIPIEKGGEYEKILPQASFNNYFSVQVRVGMEYQVFDRWAFRVNAYGSKAIQSYSNIQSGVDTRPYRLGLQTGIVFNLK